jgi:hypothetical protein
MRASRNIYAPNLNLEYLAQVLIAWYRTEHYTIERSDPGKGSVRLKCRRSKDNGEAKPSVLVTLNQQNTGLTVDIEVIKRGKALLVAALSFWAIMALLGLCAMSAGDFVGAVGFVLLVAAIAFCIICVISLSRNSTMPARTFTVIEQFVAAPQGISPPSPGALPGSRARMMPPMQQPGQHGPGGFRQTGSPRAQASGRDEPIGPSVHGTVDSVWGAGASSSRPAQRSGRDDPIGSPAPDTISGKSTFPADDLVPSAFSPREATGTTATATGAATRACSCGEMNPPDVNFCERCGKPLTGSL